jgi:ubiquinol-cytochrome c reductase cytochrome c1 subunit
MRKALLATGLLAAVLAGSALAIAQTAGEPAEPPPPLPPPAQSWSFNGVFGTFDRASAQRGYQVYNDVCANCHSLRLLAYRDLGPDGPSGGLGLSEDEVKAIAASKQVPDTNDQGDPTQRAGLPSDAFVKPFANEKAARAAQNGALPPDLSLMTKAREGGPDFLFALLTGYKDPPADMKMGEGMNFNPYFTGHQIAMPAPLNENSVTYADGTTASIEQEARDVVNFLAWAAEPNLEDRHRMGIKAILFLLAMTGVLYAAKRRIWSDVHKHEHGDD